MKKTFVFALFLFFTQFGISQKQPLQLWYTKPAVKWTDALPIGNGRIGAMVFGGVRQDRIQFNEETLWTGGPRDYNRKGAYQYLDSIRQLLFAGKQKEAEAMGEAHFMGLKSDEGKRDGWVAAAKAATGMKGNPALENYDDSQWKTMQVPSYEGWEAAGFEGLDGAVWVRTKFTLPAGWEQQDLVLDLNRVRDADLTYINGKLVGSTQTTDPRKYHIAKDRLHAGINTLAILVLNFFDKGGVAGYKDTTRHIGLYPANANARSMLSLNGQWKYFIQDDNPPPVGKYEADYQPFGDLWLNFDAVTDSSDYQRNLDLVTATAATSYTFNGVHYRREYLASQPDQVVAIHLTADRKGSINFKARMSSPHKNFTVKKIDANTIDLSVRVKNGALRGESYLQIKIDNGTLSLDGNSFNIANADEATIYLTAGTNYKNYHDVSGDPVAPCARALKSVQQKTFAQVKAAHEKEYASYFNTFSIDLGKGDNENLPTDERLKLFAKSNDPSFVALYAQYGRYLLISASRPGTRPANLQGIWNDLLTPPWGSKYTTNINAEMNYWPAELLNLSPMHQALFGMIKDLSEAGKETTKEYYNAPGWVVHHNTDLWRGTAPINASNHGIWVGGAGWLSHHLWEHYQYTQNKKFLKDTAYAIMKGAAEFYHAFLIKDPVTGWLISAPSNSPENGGLVAGPTMDHQIIRDLFKNVAAAAKLLNTDAAFANSLMDDYKRIAPNQVGRFGQLQEWLQDKDDTASKHRHVSHLWGAYPGGEINGDETPDLLKAARQSLIYRGDEATGWSLGWKINLWARFKDGDHAFNLLRMLLRPATGGAGSYVNLFDAHPPFQIDGNFGGAAGIGEMLVQSHTRYLDILPALPAALPEGEVKGICARGGYILDLTWKNGSLQHLSLYSRAGQPCIIRYNSKIINLATVAGKRYELNGKLELVH